MGDWLLDLIKNVYFVFITISTTGYGDQVVKDFDNKVINCIIIIVGICVNSLLTVTVLGVFSMNQQEENAHYLRQRLALTEKQHDYIADKFALLLDMADMEKECR